MTITLNGQPTEISDGTTLAALTAHLCRKPETVVAELNGAILDRACWASTALNANDRLELVTFVGGG